MLIRKFIDNELNRQYKDFVTYARAIFNMVLRSKYENILNSSFINEFPDLITYNNFSDNSMMKDICTCKFTSLTIEPRFLIDDSYIVQYFDIIFYGSVKHEYSNSDQIEVFLVSFLYYEVIKNTIKDNASLFEYCDNGRFMFKNIINRFIHNKLDIMILDDFNTYFKSLIHNINPLILKQPKDLLIDQTKK